jgi:hypothetical protein
MQSIRNNLADSRLAIALMALGATPIVMASHFWDLRLSLRARVRDRPVLILMGYSCSISSSRWQPARIKVAGVELPIDSTIL